MARDREPPGRKRRTRGHVIADLGVNTVERVVLECGYAVERSSKDYGLDLSIETFDDQQEVETGRIEVQVKATDAIRLTQDRQFVLFRVLVADLKRWLFEPAPIVLAVYDAVADVAYWLDVQDYARRTDVDIEEAKSVTLRIPAANIWAPPVVRELRVLKNKLRDRTRRRFPDAD